jgi:hypothetical protein
VATRDYWAQTKSGLLIPAQRNTSAIDSELSYEEIAKKAGQIKKRYAAAGVKLSPDCGLSRLCSAAAELAALWHAGNGEKVSQKLLFDAMHLNRIADAIGKVDTATDPKPYLQDLAAGDLDPHDRVREKGKDILWELELVEQMEKFSLKARLAEPDVVIDVEGRDLAAACKKLYSTENANKVYSNAVHQIEASGMPGILCINIDDLRPPNSLIAASTQDRAVQAIGFQNMQFLGSSEHTFLNYMGAARIIGVLASSSAIIQVPNSIPVVARQSNGWFRPSLPADLRDLMTAFVQKLERGGR